MVLSRVTKVFLFCLLFALMGCQPNTELPAKYQVEIIRTDFGIPHITAQDYGSLGYGEAYAAAQDHVCNMAVALTNAQGQAAMHFGSGHEDTNMHKDIVVRALDIPEKGRLALAQQPEHIKQWIQGYTAGYNRYLRDSAGQFNLWCDGEP